MSTRKVRPSEGETHVQLLAEIRPDFRGPTNGKIHAQDGFRVQLPEGIDPASEDAATEHFVAWYRHRMLYVQGLGWHAWDGKRWKPDEATPRELAKETLRRMDQAARADLETANANLKKVNDKGPELEAAEAFVKSVQSRLATIKRLEAWRGHESMTKAAADNPAIRVETDDLDKDDWLFCCDNGTLDLRTLILRSHDPKDLITRISPVPYDSHADTSGWQMVLDTATDHDTDLLRSLGEAAGYSMTGDISQDAFFMVTGAPGSIKGTVCNALRVVMGDYGCVVRFDVWAHREKAPAQRPDLAELPGKRFIFCDEVDPDKRFDAGSISNFTGGSPVNACKKYERPFSFVPKGKPWFAANKLPRVRGAATDTGLARRAKLIPFNHVIPEAERDPEIRNHYTDPKRGSPAVFRWLAERAREYYATRKLTVASAIRNRTDAYFADGDETKAFLDLLVVVREPEKRKEDWIPASRLRVMYETWCKEEGVRYVMSGNELAAYIQEQCGATRGREQSGGKRERVWYGVRERGDSDDMLDDQQSGAATQPEPEPSSLVDNPPPGIDFDPAEDWER